MQSIRRFQHAKRQTDATLLEVTDIPVLVFQKNKALQHSYD